MDQVKISGSNINLLKYKKVEKTFWALGIGQLTQFGTKFCIAY